MYHLTVIETGLLTTEDQVDALVEWIREDGEEGAGEPIGACQGDSEFIEKYWKGTTPKGRRFVFFGNDSAFEKWQRSQLT
jgi:hypothetical protein